MKRYTGRVVLGASLALTFVLSGCGIVIFPAPTAEKDFSMSTSADGAGTVDVIWINGDVTIKVDDAATRISATGKKKATGVTEELAEENLENLDISLLVSESTPKKVYLRFDVPSDTLGIIYTADVELVLPAGVTLAVENSNGDVSVTGNTEATTVDLSNGAVTIDEQEGDVTVEVANGSVDVISESGSVEVEVASGSIDIAAKPDEEDSLIAKTGVGTVEIAVPVTTKASLSLKGNVGGITAVLDGFTVTDLTTTPLNTVTATLNGGGAEIVGETAVGGVDFRSL